MSIHQDNPFEFNVGYYFVRVSDPMAADRVNRFFTATLAYLRTHNEAFDQKVINCLMKEYAYEMDKIYGPLRTYAGCKGQKILLTDPALKPLTEVQKNNWVMTWALLESDDILSSATPLLARDVSTLQLSFV